MSYIALYYKWAKKWGFASGLRGVVGSYILVQSDGEFSVMLWVSDKRCIDKRKTKTVFSSYDGNEIDKYLNDNEPNK